MDDQDKTAAGKHEQRGMIKSRMVRRLTRGSAGDDALTGGTEADFFSGGLGTDTAPDFDASQGDTKDNTIP